MNGYNKFENELSIEEPKNIEQQNEEIDFTESKKVNSSKVNDFDHIEVSLEDDTFQNESVNEVIGRANDFFLEHNDNYRLSWKEVADQLDTDLDHDPSNPPKPGKIILD